MTTQFVTTTEKGIKTEDVKRASDILKTGGLVAFPTETVYGLGGDALNPEAATKIYAAKGRPSDNPLIVHIAEYNQLQQLCTDIPESASKLAEAFWPGPLTMILKKSELVPHTTTGGLDTVAVRMPAHPVALQLIRESNVMIAAPSANTSGRPSPTKASHVREDLDGKIDMIIDGGSVQIGLESTIVDLTGEDYTILRPGYITAEDISEVLDARVEIDKAIIDTNSGIKPKAPGMKYRHYAPKASLTIVEGDLDRVSQCILNKCDEGAKEGKRIGVIATAQTFDLYRADVVYSVGDRNHEEEIAANLFDILRKFDEEEVDEIYSESLLTPHLGQAIMNRLLKAAGHKVIEV